MSTLYNNKTNHFFLFAFVIFAYVGLYPPFISSSIFSPVYRLILEFLVLSGLFTYNLLSTQGKLPKNIIYGFALLTILVLLNDDHYKQSFSFINKILFFVLLNQTLRFDHVLLRSLIRLWTLVFIYISIAAIAAFTGYVTGVLEFSQFEVMTMYPYRFHPLLGNILEKNLVTFKFPRFCGWMIEPGLMASYFGLNLFIAKNFFARKRSNRIFGRFNFTGGLLTLSLTFYVGLIAVFLYLKTIARFSNKKTLSSIVLIAMSPMVFFVWQNQELFSFSSLSNRIWRYEETFAILKDFSLNEFIAGMGILPYQGAIGAGGASAPLDLISGRGIFVTIFIVLIVYRATSYRTGFFMFIVFINLFFNLTAQPLFYLGLVLGYRSSKLPVQIQERHNSD